MPHAPVNHAKLYYEEHGQGEAVFLVHGFSGSGELWNDFVSKLAASYRLIVPDLRAHGRSTGAAETIHHDRFAADLVALMDFLGIGRAHFVGHSSGGMCLLFLGIKHAARVRTLTLVSATYTFDEHARRYMRQVANELQNQPEAIELSRQIHGPTHGADHWKVHRAAFLAFTTDPHELPFQPADLRGISSPTLIVHGDRDEFFPVYIPTRMYASIPDSELCILPATAHGLPEQRTQLLLSILEDFLNRHREA